MCAISELANYKVQTFVKRARKPRAKRSAKTSEKGPDAGLQLDKLGSYHKLVSVMRKRRPRMGLTVIWKAASEICFPLRGLSKKIASGVFAFRKISPIFPQGFFRWNFQIELILTLYKNRNEIVN